MDDFVGYDYESLRKASYRGREPLNIYPGGPRPEHAAALSVIKLTAKQPVNKNVLLL
jgi:hypothetical protein